MNIDAINADPVLKGTPIGDLKVVRMRDWLGVAVVDRWGKERIVHELKAGGCVLDAVYGKRAWEAPAVRRIYERNKAARDAVLERADADLHADLQRGLQRFTRRDSDAREAIFRAFAQ